MALNGKLETEVELKLSAEKFYGAFATQTYNFPQLMPSIIQKVDVHQGDWETDGSIKIWNYFTLDGKKETFKEKIELDDEKKKIRLVGLEGDAMKSYKVYVVTFECIPKGDGSVIKLVIEYEKLHENVPPPDQYLSFIIKLAQGIGTSFSDE